MILLARLVLASALAAVARGGAAQPWEFEKTLDVSGLSGRGIFHHLESSGRRNIAVSGTRVIVAWEDDHDGTPRIYAAAKRHDAAGFDRAIRISGSGEAYEPTLAALGDERFVVAWEEDQHVHARIMAAKRLGPAIRLSAAQAGQANASVHGGRVFVLYSQRDSRYSRIRLHALRPDSANELVSEASCAVDPAPLDDDQLYPASAVAGEDLVAAWEDRRPGHTIIMASMAKLEDVCAFRPPVRISAPRPGKRSGYGKGHGVSRVALASQGRSNVWAVWADKRHYWEGYDIYAAAYEGDGRFGPNSKVQDEFGDFARQWHAAIAGNADGRLVIAWNDEREGNSDIMLSWNDDGAWSDDLPLPGASDVAQQTHPSIVIDEDGNLHAAWVERAEQNGATRLRYQFGRFMQD